MAARQAPPSLGFSRQEHWSGLPFPSPMHESEKWKWSYSVVSNSSWPHGLQPTRLLRLWDFPGKSAGVWCHCLLRRILEWVTFPFSRGSSQPRDRIQVSRIAGWFFTSWTTKEADCLVFPQLLYSQTPPHIPKICVRALSLKLPMVKSQLPSLTP